MEYMQKIKSDLREMLNRILLLVIVALGVISVPLTHPRLKAQEARRGGPIPYTVILRETVYGPNGTASVAMDETFAVRSDGSYVHVLKHKKQTETKLVNSDSARTIEFASGITVEINDFTGAKSTTVSKIFANFQRDPGSKCINSIDGAPQTTSQVISGEEVVAGYRAVKITSNNSTWWFALDHGCAQLKSRIDWSSQEHSDKNLVELVPGEPAAALFDVPGDDKEMSPSERALGRGKGPSDCGSQRCAEILRMLDERYRANRPKK
jgi:hypothetical protein